LPLVAPLRNTMLRLETKIVHDDVPVEDYSVTLINDDIELPDSWRVGLICGPSGSGKSTLLAQFGKTYSHEWDNKKSIISCFVHLTPDDAAKLLCAVGFSSIPSWMRPYRHLSTGEKFRADLAMAISQDKDVIIIDEFTSVVDRNVAKASANSVRKYLRNHPNKRVVLASCHEDIIEWLQPDWIFNPAEGKTTLPRGCLRRPEINLEILRCKYEAWGLFKQHHYLSAGLNKSARCFLAYWKEVPVAFVGVLALPHPVIKKGWRASRTVVLPDYQGLGIGVRLSDAMGAFVKAGGGRYFSKTIHPAMINYRLAHPELWKETSHSRESRPQDYKGMVDRNWIATPRPCYAFEYVGPHSELDKGDVFWQKV